MTFYWSKEVKLLFDSWHTTTLTSYTITLLACFIVSVFSQFMHAWRLKIKLATIAAEPSKLSCGKPTMETPILSSKLGFGMNNKKVSLGEVFGGVLFGVNSAIGYLLMLGVMSFNVGVFVSVILGLSVGYVMFRSGDQNCSVEVDDYLCACA